MLGLEATPQAGKEVSSMNQDQIYTFLGLFWFISMLTGIFFFRSFVAAKYMRDTIRNKKLFPSLEDATDDNTCKGPHSWHSIKLALTGLPVGQYLVCQDCGYVNQDGEDRLKVNAAGLEVLRNDKAKKDKLTRVYNETQLKRQQKIDALMVKMVRGNVQNFDGDIHKNGRALQEFFKKTVLEIDAVYTELNKQLDEEEGRG